MKILILSIVIVMFIIDVVVSLINYRHRTQPIPENVRDVYDAEKYDKWLRYSMETLRFGLLTRTISTLLTLLLLAFGAFGWLERLTNTWFAHPILQTLAFLGVYGLFTFLISIPFDYYSTFVLEEKYGFNKSTHKTFWLDQLKNLVLFAILGCGLVAGMHALYLNFADRIWFFILLAWLSISFVILALFFINKVFVRIFNKLTPLPEGDLKTRIQTLARQVGFRVNAISVMDASRRSTKLNAFFSGLGKTREVVLYDTLVEKMGEEEIVSVLAHELGHAVHKDVPRMLLEQIVVFGVYLLGFAWVAQNTGLAQAFGLSDAHFGFSLLLFSILISPLDLLLTFPLNYLSRKAEYAADAFAVEQTSGQGIANALRILAQENLANLNPHPLYVLLHYNHPPLSQRLSAIEKGMQV